jgi:thiol-disulfide isomerase/thioredoxin
MIKKKLISLITLLFLFHLTFNLKSNDIEKIQIIKEPYHIDTLELMNYKENYSLLNDKPALYFIINFWASWCAPCIKEMKSLNSLQKKVSSLRVITISQDKSLDLAKNFFKKNKHEALEKYFDKDKKALSKFSLRGLPTTFIVDKNYKVFAKIEGIIEWDSKQFINWLNKN